MLLCIKASNASVNLCAYSPQIACSWKSLPLERIELLNHGIPSIIYTYEYLLPLEHWLTDATLWPKAVLQVIASSQQ